MSIFDKVIEDIRDMINGALPKEHKRMADQPEAFTPAVKKALDDYSTTVATRLIDAECHRMFYDLGFNSRVIADAIARINHRCERDVIGYRPKDRF